MVRQRIPHASMVWGILSYCGVYKNRPQKIACDFYAYEAHDLFSNQQTQTPLRRSSVLIRHGAPNKKVLLRLCNFSGETVRGFGLLPDLCVDIHALCLPQTRASGKQEFNLK